MTNESAMESNSLEIALSKLLDIHKTLEKLTPISDGINRIVDTLMTISDKLSIMGGSMSSLDKTSSPTDFSFLESLNIEKTSSSTNKLLSPPPMLLEKISPTSINNQSLVLPNKSDNVSEDQTCVKILKDIYDLMKDKPGTMDTIKDSIIGAVVGKVVESTLSKKGSVNEKASPNVQSDSSTVIGSLGIEINKLGTKIEKLGTKIGLLGTSGKKRNSGRINSQSRRKGNNIMGLPLGKPSQFNILPNSINNNFGTNKTSQAKSKTSKNNSVNNIMGIASMGMGALGMTGQLDLLPDSINSVIGMVSMMDLSMIKLGMSSMVMGIKMGVAWLIGLGPIGLIIAAIAGIFTLLIFNIDNVMKWWNNFIENIKGMSPIMEWIGGIFDAVIGNLLGGIKWLVDKFKELFGMAGKKPPKYEDPATDKMQEIEQKIVPTYTQPNIKSLEQNNLMSGVTKAGSTGTESLEKLNNTSKLPETHTKFLEKNNLVKGVTKAGSTGTESLEKLNDTNKLPIAHTNFLEKNNLVSGVSKAGSVGIGAKISNKINSPNTVQSSKQNTIINIDKVEIGDGIISDLDSFILQLKHRVVST